jgi:hypothetical protein
MYQILALMKKGRKLMPHSRLLSRVREILAVIPIMICAGVA